jgi:hypothetical protein
MTTVEQAFATATRALGEVTRVDLGSISARDLCRFQVAVWGSMQGTTGSPLDGARPHPLFLSSVLVWGAGPPESDLLPDGNAPDPFAGVSLGGLRLMGGGQELTMHRDVVPDTPMVMEVSIADVTMRQGRSGPLLILVMQRRFFDAMGPLVDCRETFLGRDEVA